MKQRSISKKHTGEIPSPNAAYLRALRAKREMVKKEKRTDVYEFGRLLSSKIVTYKDLGISKRTGDNYKAFYRAMSENKAQHLVEQVDPSKISLFYELLNPRNIETAVRFCEKYSVDQLEVFAASFPLLVLLNEEKKTNKGSVEDLKGRTSSESKSQQGVVSAPITDFTMTTQQSEPASERKRYDG